MRELVFQWPWMLLLLIAAIPLSGLLFRARKGRQRARVELGQTGSDRIDRRDWAWVAVYLLIVIALARPGYNPTRLAISQAGRDVVFVLDVSRSMLAQDAYPSRLEAAKQGIRDCLTQFSGEQVGLVIYAGSSSISCPLTTDYDFVSYMLSQVQPRSVEFGGTLLLSAIEKSVDQVLGAERQGYQDVVVMTDGEDHGPGVEKVAERLKESGVSLLIVGIGDAVSGSRIPIANDEGETISLKHDGVVVYTKLQDSELSELARISPGGEYAKVGTLPFHLGEIYGKFVSGKESISSDGDSGYIVYKEASFFIMPIIFLLSLWATGLSKTRKGVMGLIVLISLSSHSERLVGQDLVEAASFEDAIELFDNAEFIDAGIAFGELAYTMEVDGEDSVSIAASLFNQALCSYLQAEQLDETSPREALSAAFQAQRLFFEAARTRPGYERAGRRLESIALMVDGLEKRVQEEEKQEQERDEKIEALLERIRDLLEAQTELRQVVENADIQRRPLNRRLPNTPRAVEKEPENAVVNASRFEQAQHEQSVEGRAIEQRMVELDREFSIASAVAQESGAPALETVLKRPLELINLAVEAQVEAEELLPQWRYWTAARARQSVAIDRLQDILDLFASNSDDEGEGDWEDEDWEEYMDTDPGDAVASSLPMKGEFREDALMQPLPVPSFSPEDVLMEEMGSQQFRQEQRAKVNAGKVEKDW